MSYPEGRWMEIVDREADRIRHASPGAEYATYGELGELYGVSHSTLAKVYAELRRVGLIRRTEGFRGRGHRVTGAREPMNAQATSAYPFASVHALVTRGLHIWPEATEGNRCPVNGCGRGLKNVPRPVYGYVCTDCVRTGAAITGSV